VPLHRGGIRVSVLPRNAHRAPSSAPPARIRLRQTFPRGRAGMIGHGYGRGKEKNNAIE